MSFWATNVTSEILPLDNHRTNNAILNRSGHRPIRSISGNQARRVITIPAI